MQEKVTVVIYTYNRAGKYLDDMINSVINQTIHDIKIIIYDNGSTDDTEEYVRHYLEEDDRIQYIRAQENTMSILGRINYSEMVKEWASKVEKGSNDKGIIVPAIKEQFEVIKNACTTEYVIFTHDDDMMLPNLVEKELELIESDKKIVAVSCDISNMDTDGNIIESKSNVDNYPITYENNEYCRAYITGREFNLMILPTLMVRVSSYFEVLSFCSAYNDLGLLFELNKRGKLHIMKEKLFLRRLHGGQDAYNRLKLTEIIRYWDLPRLKECCTDKEYNGLVDKSEQMIRIAKKQQIFLDKVKSEYGLDVADLYKKIEITDELSIFPEHVMLFLPTVKYLIKKYENDTGYVIWGAGSAGRKCKYILDNLWLKSRCIAFIDPYKEGNIDGIPIVSPTDYEFNKNDIVIIGTTVAGMEVSDVLESKGYVYAENYFFGYALG